MQTPRKPSWFRPLQSGFTLIELMLSVAILAIMVLMLTSVLSSMQNVVSRTQAQVEEFEDARLAFESISRKLSQTTLNAYWGYVYDKPADPNPTPLYYSRLSDLHYVSDAGKNLLADFKGNGQAVFFQALLGDTDPSTPLGSTISNMHDLLNCWGYYVDYGSDLDKRPQFMRTGNPLTLNPERYRFRLMEFRQPPDKSVLFDPSFNIGSKTKRTDIYRWFRGPFKNGSGTTADYAVPLADNILGLIIVPYVTVTSGGSATTDTSTQTRKKTSYEFDTRLFQWRPGDGALDLYTSKNQPPPMLEISLIATDEKSYARLEDREGREGAATKIRDVFKGLLTDARNFSPDLALGSQNTANYDVTTIESRLSALDLHFKVFTTTVTLQASRFITEREGLSIYK